MSKDIKCDKEKLKNDIYDALFNIWKHGSCTTIDIESCVKDMIVNNSINKQITDRFYKLPTVRFFMWFIKILKWWFK